MPEPTVYTDRRGWPIVRKASSSTEVRDWFDEQVAFANAIDADVDALAPAGKIFNVPATSTPVDNGLNLLQAYADARSAGPSATNIINIRLQSGDYDLNGAMLEMDTDYINIIGDTQAHRTNWHDYPQWTDVQRAGSRIYTNRTGSEATPIYLTALNAVIIGVDMSNTNTDENRGIIIHTAFDAQHGPAVIGCSIDGTVDCRVPVALYFLNTHARLNMGGNAFVTTGNLCGTFIRVSACGGDSFNYCQNIPVIVRDSIFTWSRNSNDNSFLDDVQFQNCRIFAPGVRLFESEGINDTVNTKFVGGYIMSGGYGGNSSSIPSSAQFIGVEWDCSDYIYLDNGGSLIGNRFDLQGVSDALINLNNGAGVINGNIISNLNCPHAITMGETPTGTLRITGNIIDGNGVAGDGIDQNVSYEGGNLLTGKWVDTNTISTDGITVLGDGTNDNPLMSGIAGGIDQEGTINVIDTGSGWTDLASVQITANHNFAFEAEILISNRDATVIPKCILSKFSAAGYYNGSSILFEYSEERIIHNEDSDNISVGASSDGGGVLTFKIFINPGSLDVKGHYKFRELEYFE